MVHVGTGMTGSVALRAIIDDPALDLIGVKVSSPTKVARMPALYAAAPMSASRRPTTLRQSWRPSLIASPTARPPFDVKTR